MTDTNPSERRSLEGKAALITGGARGIGLATARNLARLGADVALVDIAEPVGDLHIHGYRLSSPEDLASAEAEVAKEGGRVLTVRADVRDSEALRQAADEAAETFGGLDILVADAGMTVWGPFAETTPAQARDAVDINLLGVAHAVWAVLPHFRARGGGRIVALSSIAGRMGVPGMSVYGAAKWGVIGLIKSLAIELGPEGITANVVAPSGTNTPMYRSEGQIQAMGLDGFEALEAAGRGMHPLGVPHLEPENIADAITFLLSDQARLITGAVLDVAAGANARFTA